MRPPLPYQASPPNSRNERGDLGEKKLSKAEAGSKGGKKTVKRYGKRYMKKLGKWGGHRTRSLYRLEPVDLNDFAMVNRETGKVKAYLSGKKPPPQ